MGGCTDGSYATDRTGENLNSIENDLIDFFENDIEIAKPEYSTSQANNGIALTMKSPIALFRTGLSVGIAF